ncbi:hypothetical protein E0485_24870 [Paenibacillus albiflavus]|uniref:KOW domain-containing protein n=1 Tax=Paenibacillus albiflavus TaxID=2545760 RepID=A0A4R4DXS8_9BACL|nr:KOW domain-containing RNA-binding protein [Paenibacillus albiflavus]TCZ67571.1 hypothetical protein E0485_24870 [Paenibacillus albiflavus]
MSKDKSPRVGQIAKVLSGRHHGKYTVLIGIVNDRYVLIADGHKRKFDFPKKKNLLHLQLMGDASEEVVSSLKETGRVTNGKLRLALKQFSAENAIDAHEKGE